MSGNRFEEVAIALTEELRVAEIDTINKLLSWKEVTDRTGFKEVVEYLAERVKQGAAEKGDTGVAVVVSYALVLGARYSREGLL